MRHGNTFNFDSLGRLATIVDQYGNPLTVTYLNSTSSLPQSVTDWKSRKCTFTYNNGTSNQLISVSDGTRTVNYGYSSAAISPTSPMPGEKTTTYTYDANHQITATIDALGRTVITNLYDSQGTSPRNIRRATRIKPGRFTGRLGNRRARPGGCQQTISTTTKPGSLPNRTPLAISAR